MRWVIAVIAAVTMTADAAAQSPCAGPPADQPLRLSRPVATSIVREFGDTWDDKAGKKQFHPGVNFEVLRAEPVYAAQAGRVVAAAAAGALGLTIRIDHGGGLQTLYGNLATASVSPGTCVKAGEQIGVAGRGPGADAGATGTVLHLELLRGGKAEDPTPLLQ